MLLKPHCGAFGLPFMKMRTRFPFTSRAMKSWTDSVLPPLYCCGASGQGREEGETTTQGTDVGRPELTVRGWENAPA